MSSLSVRGTRRAGSAALAALLAFGLLLLGLAVPGVASADTRPDPGTPATVVRGRPPHRADQRRRLVDGHRGEHGLRDRQLHHRPAGRRAAGTGTPRANLLAFDIRTGALITSFDHTLNGQGRIIVASPDGSRIYVGGDFTTVDGLARGHIAAFDVATGALVPGFAPTSNAGGLLAGRRRAPPSTPAATSPPPAARPAPGSPPSTRPNGALTAWAPTANNTVRGIVRRPHRRPDRASPASSAQVNGITAFSIASVNDTAGGDAKSQPWGINNTGDPAGAWSLKMYGGIAYATRLRLPDRQRRGRRGLQPERLSSWSG